MRRSGVMPPLVGMRTALTVHLIAGPSGFAALALLYHRRVATYSPLTVILVDFALVGLVIMGSLDMYRGPVGTWIPFTLIFAVSWAVGVRTRRGRGRVHALEHEGAAEPGRDPRA